jgi:hypothetical protein
MATISRTSIGVDFAAGIASIVFAKRSPDFAGLGFVVYDDPIALPSVALGSCFARPPLPVRGVQDIGLALARVSAHSSSWHDGFHFVECTSGSLTHVSQFLAPDLEILNGIDDLQIPFGARQLTALLVSKYECTDCVALLSTDGELIIYRNGRIHERGAIRHA